MASLTFASPPTAPFVAPPKRPTAAAAAAPAALKWQRRQHRRQQQGIHPQQRNAVMARAELEEVDPVTGEIISGTALATEAGERVAVDGRTWAYRRVEPNPELNNPTQLPVLCLHGIGSSSYIFRNTIRLLGEAGHEAIAVDWLGHGASEKVGAAAARSRCCLPLSLSPVIADAPGSASALDALRWSGNGCADGQRPCLLLGSQADSLLSGASLFTATAVVPAASPTHHCRCCPNTLSVRACHRAAPAAHLGLRLLCRLLRLRPGQVCGGHRLGQAPLCAHGAW